MCVRKRRPCRRRDRRWSTTTETSLDCLAAASLSVCSLLLYTGLPLCCRAVFVFVGIYCILCDATRFDIPPVLSSLHPAVSCCCCAVSVVTGLPLMEDDNFCRWRCICLDGYAVARKNRSPVILFYFLPCFVFAYGSGCRKLDLKCQLLCLKCDF